LRNPVAGLLSYARRQRRLDCWLEQKNGPSVGFAVFLMRQPRNKLAKNRAAAATVGWG
jgi:hypothetical protein